MAVAEEDSGGDVAMKSQMYRVFELKISWNSARIIS